MVIKKLMIFACIVAVAALAACNDDASIASYNISNDADYFKVDRRIIFYNGITDTYMFSIEGKCSINVDNQDNQLEVTCKTGDAEFKKHYLGLSDNTTYFVEQLQPVGVDVYHYKVVFKPSSIIPDVDVK